MEVGSKVRVIAEPSEFKGHVGTVMSKFGQDAVQVKFDDWKSRSENITPDTHFTFWLEELEAL